MHPTVLGHASYQPAFNYSVLNVLFLFLFLPCPQRSGPFSLTPDRVPSQELGVPLVVVGRHAVYSAAVPASLYDELAQTNSPMAKELQSSQRLAIDQLWQRVQAPQGSSARGDMPNRCTAQWFSQVLA